MNYFDSFDCQIYPEEFAEMHELMEEFYNEERKENQHANV